MINKYIENKTYYLFVLTFLVLINVINYRVIVK